MSESVGTFRTQSSDPRFQLEGFMEHPLSHQEAIDAAAKEHQCVVPDDLTVTHDTAGEAMRNRPEGA